jgi:PEP-CTERM motif-containing protein
MISRTSRIGVLGLAVSAMFVGGSIAQAGILADNDGGALAGFTGTKFFDDNFFGFTVSANVDYAVFAPGAFGVAFPGLDPSGGTDYVYAYQIDNLDTNITKLTVGLDGDEALGSIGSIADVGAVDPSAALYVGSGPSSAAWDFTGLGNGQSSALLFFTSAEAPELHISTVAADWSNTQDLPSPLPEPASLSLLAIGAGFMCVGKRRRV